MVGVRIIVVFVVFFVSVAVVEETADFTGFKNSGDKRCAESISQSSFSISQKYIARGAERTSKSPLNQSECLARNILKTLRRL